MSTPIRGPTLSPHDSARDRLTTTLSPNFLIYFFSVAVSEFTL